MLVFEVPQLFSPVGRVVLVRETCHDGARCWQGRLRQGCWTLGFYGSGSRPEGMSWAIFDLNALGKSLASHHTPEEAEN